MPLQAQYVESGEAGAEAHREDQIIGERGRGDADIIGINGYANTGVEVSEQGVTRGRAGGDGGFVDWVASYLKISVGAHFEGDFAVGDGAKKIRAAGETESVPKPPGVKIEDSAPNSVRVIVLPSMSGESEVAMVSSLEVVAKFMSASSDIFVTCKIDTNNTAGIIVGPMFGAGHCEIEMAQHCGAKITSILSRGYDDQVDVAARCLIG